MFIHRMIPKSEGSFSFLGRLHHTKREKAILEQFGKKKRGKQATRQEMITLHRKLGRKLKTVKRWTRETIRIHKPEKVVQSFRDLCSIKTKSNDKYIAACGPQCSKELGPQNLFCPTCRKSIWHERCLLTRFKIYDLEQPILEGKWKCVDCVLKQ